jgi:hypothetical protein
MIFSQPRVDCCTFRCAHAPVCVDSEAISGEVRAGIEDLIALFPGVRHYSTMVATTPSGTPSREQPEGRKAVNTYPLPAKIKLLWRVWWSAARVALALRTHSLPGVVSLLGTTRDDQPEAPALLSRAVARGLRIGPWQPRCLVRSLVLYDLLRSQGEAAQLVIGLPEPTTSWDAHAWVELDGQDVGPAPGAGGHRELLRYPVSSQD